MNILHHAQAIIIWENVSTQMTLRVYDKRQNCSLKTFNLPLSSNRYVSKEFRCSPTSISAAVWTWWAHTSILATQQGLQMNPTLVLLFSLGVDAVWFQIFNLWSRLAVILLSASDTCTQKLPFDFYQWQKRHCFHLCNVKTLDHQNIWILTVGDNGVTFQHNKVLFS